MSNTLMNYFKKVDTPGKNDSFGSASKSVEKKPKIEAKLKEDKENVVKRRLVKEEEQKMDTDEEDEEIHRPLRSCPNSVLFLK